MPYPPLEPSLIDDTSSESSDRPSRQQTIFVIRHGLGEHNVAAAGYLMDDAMLTPHGVDQARQLRSSPALAAYAPPQLQVVSPLRRCMHTAYHAFGPKVPCKLMPGIMETGTMRCDCANPILGRALLEECEWDELLHKYVALPPNWAVKDRKWKESVCARFADTMAWIAARPEEHIALIGHHDFFRSNLVTSLQPGELKVFLLCDGELTCPIDPSFLWRMSDGIVSRKGAKTPVLSRSASSSPMLGKHFFNGRRGTASVPSSPEPHTRTAFGPALEAAAHKTGLPSRGVPFPRLRSARSVHGGDVHLKMVKEQADEQAREKEMGKGRAVHGGDAFAGRVLLGE
jgi:broad specificity phosphatase PhoE